MSQDIAVNDNICECEFFVLLFDRDFRSIDWALKRFQFHEIDFSNSKLYIQVGNG